MPIINNNKTDPNKILPMQYLWARQHYKDGVANNWTPEEIPMQQDIELWKSKTGLTDTERRMILWNVGFFSTAESLTANNIILALYSHVTNPECRQYMLRQAFEEAIHTDCFIYCCDSLGLHPEEIYSMYETIPSIKEKDDFVIQLTKNVFQSNFTTEGIDNVQKLIHDLIGYYIIMEGIYFYAGFAMMLALKRKNKMVGIGEQFEYIMRDESLHLAFGADLTNTIIRENPETWTEDFKKEIVSLVEHAVQLEKNYAHDACPEGILGINAEQFCHYVEYIADRRLERIHLPPLYGTENPFPWMSQATDLAKEKNFFETRVTEYQIGGSLEWEE